MSNTDLYLKPDRADIEALYRQSLHVNDSVELPEFTTTLRGDWKGKYQYSIYKDFYDRHKSGDVLHFLVPNGYKEGLYDMSSFKFMTAPKDLIDPATEYEFKGKKVNVMEDAMTVIFDSAGKGITKTSESITITPKMLAAIVALVPNSGNKEVDQIIRQRNLINNRIKA